jgi:inner membrane protein
LRSYTHIAGAIVLFLSFAYVTNLNHLLVGILFTGWISLFPDIFDRLLGKHRGYGHSIFWIIPCLLVAFFNVTIAIALIIGIISHVLLDVITTHGTPILYPLWKTNFVILNQKRRIKTGTNHDKAVFIALIFLLIPILFFTIPSFHNDNSPFDISTTFASNSSNENKILNNNNSDSVKNNFNINLQLKEKTNKNISIKKVNENETTVLIKDIETGG